MTTGSTAFTIDRGGTFPTFCAVSFRGAGRAVAPWVDFWAVNPCGDPAADYARGRRYGDEAIGHVRTTGQPVFIECVLMFMSMKLRHREAGELELGFVDRIASDFPDAMDGVMHRLARYRRRRLS
jgi:hypothetical protein